ncbi:MAG: hypothetical protein AABY93_00120 [Bacteroidota bacterium]
MNNFNKMTVTAFLALILFLCMDATAQNQKPADESFTVEGYYKVRWGYVDEFIDLYKKNHYPLLKKAIEKGDLLAIKAEKPLHHNTEEGRWDFKVTLVFKNVQAAFDPNLTEPYKKALYPDLDKLVKDEHHRFELLIAHWDVPVTKVELEK